jgi:hypothetical protein
LSFLFIGMTKSNKKTPDFSGVYVPFTIKLSNHFIVDLKRLHYAYMLLTKKPQFNVAQF